MEHVSKRLRNFAADREYHPCNWYSRLIKQQIDFNARNPNTTDGQLWSRFLEIMHSEYSAAKSRLRAGLKALDAAA